MPLEYEAERLALARGRERHSEAPTTLKLP